MPRTPIAADQDEQDEAVARSMVAVNQLVTFLTSGFKSYSGKRNLFDAFGYAKELKTEDIWSMYLRGGIARTIIERFPTLAWGEKFDLVETENPEVVPEGESEFSQFAERVGLSDCLLKADILSGLGYYSAILIGAPPQDLSTELESGDSLDDVQYLKPLSERQLEIVSFEKSGRRAGLPLMYKTKIDGLSHPAFKDVKPTEIHWSRIIHLVQNGLESRVFGHPTICFVWNLLYDIQKILGAIGETIFRKAKLPVHLKANIEELLKMKQASKGSHAANAAKQSSAKLAEELEAGLHGFKDYIETAGYDVSVMQANIDKVSTTIDAHMQQIAGAIRIPLRELIGSERGELSSGQDAKSRQDETYRYRASRCESLINEVVERFVQYGYMERKKRKIQWPQAEEMDELQKGELAFKISQANKNQIECGDTLLRPSAEIRDCLWSLRPVEEEEDKNKLKLVEDLAS